MDNVEAAYTLITAEAERRHKDELFVKKASDLCGKIVEVTRELDQKLLFFMEKEREKERGKTYDKERCRDCCFWNGPGISVDHAHCKDRRSPIKTTSKYGDKSYDRCVYFLYNSA